MKLEGMPTSVSSLVVARLLGVKAGTLVLAEVIAAREPLQREGLWVAALQACLLSGLRPPAEALEELRASVFFELKCKAMLAELARVVYAQQIPVLVFKGCALMIGVYPYPGQRSFGDIDLAVAAEHQSRFRQALSQLGYFVSETGPVARKDGINVDIHTHPLQQLSFALAGNKECWWARSEALGDDFLGLNRNCIEHEFLLALFHGAKHAFSRANWVVDVAVIATRYDPVLLAAAVRSNRAGRHLWLAAVCLDRWFGVCLPQELLTVSRPPGRFSPLNRLFLQLVLERRAPDFLGMFTPLWAISGVAQKLGYLKSVLFPKSVKFSVRSRELVAMVEHLIHICWHGRQRDSGR